jgi:hydrogenase nickel incorporation protein HypA/HybF
MHELGLAQGVLEVALDAAGDAPVTAIRVRIGDLHAVLPESFEYCFRIAAEATAAEQARIEIEPVPVRLRCDVCGMERGSELAAMPCTCGATTLHVVGGDELTVSGVQLADGGWLLAPATAAVAAPA